MTLATRELLSYIVTVVYLPFAIGVFIFEQRKGRGTNPGIFHRLAQSTMAKRHSSPYAIHQ